MGDLSAIGYSKAKCDRSTRIGQLGPRSDSMATWRPSAATAEGSIVPCAMRRSRAKAGADRRNAALTSIRHGANTSRSRGRDGLAHDVDVAMREYVKATSQSLLITQIGASATEPLSRCSMLSHDIGHWQELSGGEAARGDKMLLSVDRELSWRSLGLPATDRLRRLPRSERGATSRSPRQDR